MTRIPMPDVVVFLPGISGSVLRRDGRDVWAPSAGAVIRGLVSFGRTVRTLALDAVDDDWRQPDLGDGVTAPRLVPDVHLIPGLWKIDGYTGIERFLLDTFELTRGENYHAFPYDWRRDNRASAHRLASAGTTWLHDWRERSGRADAQLVLIGHSMGGLVARYFVEVFEGWRDTRAVITLGTPYYGSLNAVDFLVNGHRAGFGPVRLDVTDVLRSCTSIHQLVPVYRCVYGADGTAVPPSKAGLPNWQPRWDEHLVTLHEEMNSAAAANRNDPGFAANPVVYRPIVGIDQPTRQSVRVSGDTVELLHDRAGRDDGGDGTVPTVSAALAGTEDQRTFAPQRHSRLQNHAPVLGHLKGVMATLYQPRIDDLRAAATAWFSYDGEDIHLAGQPVGFRIRAHTTLTEEFVPTVPASIRVTDATTDAVVVDHPSTIGREWQPVEIGTLSPGTYRIEVIGGEGTVPVSDVIVVAEPADVAP